MPTAPQWFSFLGSYVVPKKYMEQVGVDEFRKKPIGSGPYRLVEYELNSRIVLERNRQVLGPQAKIKRVIYQIIKDPSARVAAIQSGKADFVINVPVREVHAPQSRRASATSSIRSRAIILLQMPQRPRLRRQECAARRASRHRQGGAVEGVL